MRAYVCDVCGKTVKQVIRIDANLEHTSSNSDLWSAGSISGDYCQDCTDKIILFMYDLKGEGDSFNAKALRAEMNRKS